MADPSTPARVVTRDDELRDVAAAAARATRVAVDLEASGMFAYRAAICTMQLAWAPSDGTPAVIVDALAVAPGGLRALLGQDGPVKIVHDVAFDARLLAEAGIELGNVHDTALAARMLGRSATGLAALLESELGVRITKELQQHDWRERPLDARALGYLAEDVRHLVALDERLWTEVEARGIGDEILEETRYRLAGAVAAVRAPDDSPPYTRVKGADRLSERELAALRAVADVREAEARRRDVPPYRVASGDALVAIARERPRTASQVARIRGVPRGGDDAGRFAQATADALRDAGDALPPEERARLERPRMPAAEAKARRDREARLTAWRREAAAQRGVDEQVVLPGHCLKDAAQMESPGVDDLARVPGIGAFRVARDGQAIVRAIRGEGAP